MKILIIFTILLLPFITFAENFLVEIKGRDKPLSCNDERAIDGFLCLSGDEYIIVKSFGDSFPASGKLKGDDRAKGYEVTSIKSESDGSLLYESSPSKFSFGGNGTWKDNRPKSLSDDYSDVSVAMMSIAPSNEYATPSKKYYDFLTSKSAELQKVKDEILKEYASDTFKVKLDDESELSCKREKTKAKDSFDLGYEKQFKENVNCGLFDCGPDKNGNIRVLLSHYSPQQPYSEVLLLSPEGIKDGPKLEKLYSKDGKVPLVVNAKISEEMLNSYRGKTEFTPKDFVPDNLKDQSNFFNNSSYPGYETYVFDTIHLCDSGLIGKMKKSFEAHDKKKLNSKLVQYISAANNSLKGFYLPSSSVPENACQSKGVYYNPDYQDDAEDIAPNEVTAAITLDKAKELFSKAQAMDDIAWNYKQDGCYARAHLMARRFEDMGVEVNKIWMKGELAVEVEGEGTIEWNFHVAPVVTVKDKDGKKQQYVIDPSIFGEPVPVQDWVKKISKPSLKVEKTAYPFPDNSALYKRNSYTFSNADPYLPNDSLGMSEEYKMNLSNDTMLRYKGY